MGKTALSTDLAVALAGRYGDVVMFELEMPEEECVDRMITQRSLVSVRHVERPELRTPSQIARITDAREELERLPIHIDDTAGISLREIQSKSRAIAAAAQRERSRRIGAGESLDGYQSPHGMAAVIVDYLQLVKYNGEARSRDEAIGAITRGLKELAKEINVPVFALSQLNRAVETRGGDKQTKNRPVLSDLRESGNIEQDSDKIVFVYRESYYDKTADKRVAELILAKNRQGETGSTEIGWAPWCMRFHAVSGLPAPPKGNA